MLRAAGKELVDRALLAVGLALDELADELKQQEEKYWVRHRADVAQGKYPDALDLARAMGKLDGIRAILRAPEKAASIMERLEKEEEAS